MTTPDKNDDNIQQLHDDSVKKYPTLNLSKREYVITEVPRHWIGLVAPLLGGGVLALLVILGLAAYPLLAPHNNLPFESVLLVAMLVLILIGLGTYIVVWVYMNNQFYLTNECIIQEAQLSLFAHNEQTVGLSNIGDASYTQTGILQNIFNFGSIRLNIEGEETAYQLQFVANPKHKLELINNSIEEFKKSSSTAE